MHGVLFERFESMFELFRMFLDFLDNDLSWDFDAFFFLDWFALCHRGSVTFSFRITMFSWNTTTCLSSISITTVFANSLVEHVASCLDLTMLGVTKKQNNRNQKYP